MCQGSCHLSTVVSARCFCSHLTKQKSTCWLIRLLLGLIYKVPPQQASDQGILSLIFIVKLLTNPSLEPYQKYSKISGGIPLESEVRYTPAGPSATNVHPAASPLHGNACPATGVAALAG